VDNYVENLWITCGKLLNKKFSTGFLTGYPQVIHIVIHRFSTGFLAIFSGFSRFF
jgi:hypothetical protein